MGAKRGESLPRYPVALTRAANTVGDLPEGPSCAEALGDLPDVESFSALIGSDEVRVKKRKTVSDYAAELRCVTDEAWHFGYRRAWDCAFLTSSNRTHHTDISRRRFRETREGDVEPISRFFKLPRNGGDRQRPRRVH
jgi:DNA (cytosine-5)-methyltransferase 1